MIFAGYLVSILTIKCERRCACGVLARKHFAERCSGNRERNSSWVVLYVHYRWYLGFWTIGV